MDLQNKIQELADNLGFDLEKLPHGYKFKLDKISADFYHTTGTLVICQPKKNQIVKKKVCLDDLKDILANLSKIKKDTKMSELISGKEAKLAWANGHIVQWRHRNDGAWIDLLENRILSCFDDARTDWRIKPRTIMIGDVEVAACGSDYKFGESMYVLNSLDPKEYSRVVLDANDDVPAYWWRTEDEIKQVVAALKKLFKGE